MSPLAQAVIGITLAVLVLGGAVVFIIWNTGTLKSLNNKLSGKLKDDK